MNTVRELAAEVLERGADKWESGEVGHLKGHMHDGDPNATSGIARCAEGMIWICTVNVLSEKDMLTKPDHNRKRYRRHGTRRKAREALWAHLNETYTGKSYTGISGWNDKKERTPEEVIEAFKQTAKNLRNES